MIGEQTDLTLTTTIRDLKSKQVPDVCSCLRNNAYESDAHLLNQREEHSFLKGGSEHFRCVPVRFSMSILWEFNLIPIDISPGRGFQKKTKQQKLGQDRMHFFQALILFWMVFFSPHLSLTLCLPLSLSRPFLQRLFYLICLVLATLALGLRGLLWTNPPQIQ